MQNSRRESRQGYAAAIRGVNAEGEGGGGVRLTYSGKRAGPGDGFFGDLTKEGERLLFNLQPPRYQPLLLPLYPQIIAPLRPWPYVSNAGSVPPRSGYSDW